MTSRTRRSDRRTEALSRERIVRAAVELLDATGERGLTFRALTERLATGPGAIYWHVANKDELLDAATDTVVASVLAGRRTKSAKSPRKSPQDEIRAVALGLFDATEKHPWLATQLTAQLSRNPWKSVTPRIFEGIGQQIGALDVPEERWFIATSALVHYILGAASQNTANGQIVGSEVDRGEFLDAVSRAWRELDPDDYPFARAVAGQLREHDDREQFLAGVDLILAGVAAQSSAQGRSSVQGQSSVQDQS